MIDIYMAVMALVVLIFGVVALQTLERIDIALEDIIDRQGKVINQNALIITELKRINADDLEGLEIMDLSHPE